MTGQKADGQFWAPDVETMAPTDLGELNDRLLRSQLGYVAARSSFYRRLLGPDLARLERIRTTDELRTLPFTEKEDLRSSLTEHPPLGDHVAVSIDEIVRVHASSGTTGRPSYVGLTPADSHGWAEMTARCLYATGLRPASRIAYAFNIGLFCGGPANLDAIQMIGAMLVPVGTGASERLVNAMLTLGVDHLTCTPSYAQYLAEYVRVNHRREPGELGVRRLMVGGEPGGGVPSVRDKIQTDWNAEAFDAMGNADLAPVFLAECEEQAGMHFMGQSYLHAEVIDPDTGAQIPMEEGAEGELVVTHLQRECMPLIRFRTRDRVVIWTRPCPCGRTSFRMRCVGRTDDMLIVRGVNVFPSAVRDVVGRARPRTTGELLIELDRAGPSVEPPLRVLVEHGAEVPAGELPGLAEELERTIRDSLVVRASVTLVPPGSLPRAEMKSQYVRVSHEAAERA